MGFNDLLKKLFGNKSQRDLKEIEPYIQKIKAISPELEKLSNDELRHRIDMVKQHIQDSVADDRKRIAELKEHVETLDYDKRESTWEEIDKIEKEILKKIEDVLDFIDFFPCRCSRRIASRSFRRDERDGASIQPK